MAVIPTAADAWTLEGTKGVLHRGALSAQLDVARPELGLRHVCWNGRELSGQILAVRRRTKDAGDESARPLEVADAYVRGHDLVASYQASDDWPFSPQLYWGAEPLQGFDQQITPLSLVISVETHLLDTWPWISVGSQFSCGELFQVISQSGAVEPLQLEQAIRPGTSPCCLLHRFAELPISYVETMPANDFRELSAHQDADGNRRADWHLFADFLEKGVIRKARLQCSVVPRENDLQLALACCAAVERHPLPLTT